LPADGGDIPIGIDADWSYSEHELALPAGDVVLAVGTDGIWETENAQGEQFGRERFRALVRAHAAQSAGALCSTILEEVARYRGSLPAADDVTLVIVKFAVALA
jgi:sigma-B regulation protein RsbU (phosphoserine phosphatase)